MTSKMKVVLLAASCASAIAMIGQASAQEVVFRRPIPKQDGGAYQWDTTSYRPVDGSGNTLDPSTLCGSYSVARTASCVRVSGGAVDPSYCSGIAQPPLTGTQSFSAACTYSWTSAGWNDPGSSCTSSETQTRSVSCRTDQTGVIVPDASCGGGKPASSRTVADYSACGYSWQTGGWSDPGASCTSSEAQSRSVSCLRSDGTTVSDASCSGAKPAASRSVSDYSGCSYSWDAGGWVNPTPSCTSSETQTRSVSCRRSDGAVVADSSCSGAKPATSQSVADYSACTTSWQTGAWNAGSASCTANETQNRWVSCVRSDGTTVADSNCSGTKPSTSRSEPDYSGCSYSWSASGWGSWSSTCSASASRSRSVSCRRSDGTTVADSSCSGTKPSSSESSAVYSGCTYSFTASSWVDPGPGCTDSETQSRTVKCQRSDGTNVSGSYCSGAAPSSTRTVSDYSACASMTSVQWGPWAWNSTCSSSATRTRTGACLVNGSPAAAKYCETYGGKPLTQSVTESNMTGCPTCVDNGLGDVQADYRCSGSVLKTYPATEGYWISTAKQNIADCAQIGGTCFQVQSDKPVAGDDYYNDRLVSRYTCHSGGSAWVDATKSAYDYDASKVCS